MFIVSWFMFLFCCSCVLFGNVFGLFHTFLIFSNTLLLPPHSFDSVSDLLEPVANGKSDNCFISKSYDAASHFEACAEDVLGLYKLITGEELDMSISAEMNEEDM